MRFSFFFLQFKREGKIKMLKETIAFVILSLYVSACSAVCVTQPLIVGEITDADINDPGVIAAAAYANNFLWED
jgi:hypothetical protein